MEAVNEDRDLYIVLTRLEGKIDTSLAVHGGDIETLKKADSDKEQRLRIQEAKSTVTIGQLWTGILGAITAASGIAVLIKTMIP